MRAEMLRPASILRWSWSLVQEAKAGPSSRRSATLLSLVYRLWLVSFLLKMLGSSWDVAWHFKWLRDDLAPPHLLNSVGTAGVVALTAFHTYTRFGVDKLALRLMQWGVGIFLVAIPVDVLNHKINGLDITAWSPSHFLLFIGTALMLLGVIRGWQRHAPPGRTTTLTLGAFWLFFLENVLFPNQHQEYGVREIASWDATGGQHPFAEPSLLAFAANQQGRPVDRSMIVAFSLPVPSWVYPAWLVCAGLLVLVAARLTMPGRWAATAIGGAYVAYRSFAWIVLAGTGFPRSAVPFALLLGAVAIDLLMLVGLPWAAEAPLGAVLVTGAVYAGLYVQDLVLDAPPVAYWSALAAAPVLAACWAALSWLVRSGTLSTRREPMPPGLPAAA